jgi:secreted trypsin-like serine protease
MDTVKKSKQSLKIINGSIADYKVYPFFGILYIDDFASCGSSYIGGPYNAVITAAHCLVDINNIPVDKTQLKVGFLQSRLSIQNFMYNVSKVIIHPYYNNETADNDIAIIFLSEKPNIAITPLKIPSREQAFEFIKPSRPTEVIGYGLTCVNCNIQPYSQNNLIFPKTSMSTDDIIENFNYKQNKTTPIKPQIMRKGLINMVSKIPSKYNFYLPGEITPRMILAGKFNVYANPIDNVDASQGDSGGPLLYNYKGKYQLIGLVSWGKGSGVTGYPTVYTYVNYYRNWIKKKTNICYL